MAQMLCTRYNLIVQSLIYTCRKKLKDFCTGLYIQWFLYATCQRQVRDCSHSFINAILGHKVNSMYFPSELLINNCLPQFCYQLLLVYQQRR